MEEGEMLGNQENILTGVHLTQCLFDYTKRLLLNQHCLVTKEMWCIKWNKLVRAEWSYCLGLHQSWWA